MGAGGGSGRCGARPRAACGAGPDHAAGRQYFPLGRRHWGCATPGKARAGRQPTFQIGHQPCVAQGSLGWSGRRGAVRRNSRPASRAPARRRRLSFQSCPAAAAGSWAVHQAEVFKSQPLDVAHSSVSTAVANGNFLVQPRGAAAAADRPAGGPSRPMASSGGGATPSFGRKAPRFRGHARLPAKTSASDSSSAVSVRSSRLNGAEPAGTAAAGFESQAASAPAAGPGGHRGWRRLSVSKAGPGLHANFPAAPAQARAEALQQQPAGRSPRDIGARGARHRSWPSCQQAPGPRCRCCWWP